MIYHVTVKPGVGKDEIMVDGEEILLRTRKKAHDGEANEAVVEMLAKYFKVGKTRVVILKGAKTRVKTVEIA